MNKNAKRLLSLVLCLMLVLSVLPLAALAANNDTLRVYCQAPDGWSNCNAYWWGSAVDNPGWPGNAMSADEDGIWYIDIPADASNIIFNNGGSQSPDLDVPTTDKVMYVYSTKTWDVYGKQEIVLSYYLAGWINNTDVGAGTYEFVNGKLEANFAADSYVYVQTSDGQSYMAEAYCQDTTCTLAAGKSEKMFVPGNTDLTFTLTVNEDGTLTLSYVAAHTHEYAETGRVDATCTEAGSITSACTVCGAEKVEAIPADGHTLSNGVCTVCGYSQTYYLAGWINNTDVGAGTYLFEDGKLEANFAADSYVYVQTADYQSYMAAAFCQDTTCTLAIGNGEKMFVPGNTDLTFTLTVNEDGTLTLSYVAAHSHDYAETGRVEATCTEEGSITFTCAGCGDEKVETIPAAGHTLSAGVCTVCGYAQTYYLAGYINGADVGAGTYLFEDGKLEVNFAADSYVYVQTADYQSYMAAAFCQDTTCTLAIGNGEKMFVPGNTDLVFTLTINEDGTLTLSYETAAHEHGTEFDYQDNGDGTHTVTYACCGEVYAASEEHSYTDGACSCGVQEVINNITIYFENNWKWSDLKVYYWTANSCPVEWPGTEMTKETTTREGNDVYSVSIPDNVVGIIFNGTGEYGSEQCADITSGWYDGICYYMIYDEATGTKPCGSYTFCGHSYDDGVQTVAPDCKNVGVMTYTCSECGDSYTEEIPALGHTPVTDEAVAPDCTNTGLTEGQHCGVCGETLLAQEVVPATGEHIFENGECIYGCGTQEVVLPGVLKFYGASLKLENDLAIMYYVDAALFAEDAFADPYVQFTFNGAQTVVEDYTVSGNYYIFTFENIAPHWMNDQISATLIASYEGVEYQSELLNYSVATYCYKTLARLSDDVALRTLLVDILNYGAASQTYLGYNTDALVNATLTEEQKAWGTQEDRTLTSILDAAYETIDNPTVVWKGATLILQNNIKMRFYFQAESVEGLSVKIVDEQGRKYQTTSIAQEGGYYVVDFEEAGAGQMSEAVYVTVYDGDTAVSHTLSYSVESYAYSNQNADDVNLANLVKAMMKYGDAAYAYAN